MRGRGRKGPNPLSRSYESNGPDVKIRGTAQHIAEKYQQLARDAQASGDRIMSENYLQHAEHYQRIVAAAQAHLQPAAQQPSRTENEESSSDNAANNAAPSGAVERKERAETPAAAPASENMIAEDSPQPFIEDMPVIDAAGQVNGHAADAAAESGNGEDDDAKPRRRPRGTRGRGVKRGASEGADDAPAEAAPESVASPDEEAPKPRARRTPRARKPKQAEETSETDALPAGE